MHSTDGEHFSSPYTSVSATAGAKQSGGSPPRRIEAASMLPITRKSPRDKAEISCAGTRPLGVQ